MPGRKTTSINYSLDKSYINCTRTFLQLFNRFQNKLHNEAKKTSRSLPKISSFHQNAANIISEKEKIDNLEKANKLQKHMKDLSLRLKKQEQRFSTLNSSKIILENVKKRKKLSITEKIIKELEVESKKRKEIEKNKTEQEMLKPIKLKNRIENKKSIVYLKDNTQSSSSLILIKNSLEPSNHLKREIAKSNFKPLTEIEIQKAVNDRLNAKVYEKGESIDVNEGMHRKVKTFFMLQSDEENVFDGKEKKKEYINKYAKLITENINENIKRINLKLAVLNKEKKSYSLHN